MRASPRAKSSSAALTSIRERGIAFDGARLLGREAEPAPSDQQKRQNSADLLPSGTLPAGGAIGGMDNNFSVNAATETASKPAPIRVNGPSDGDGERDQRLARSARSCIEATQMINRLGHHINKPVLVSMPPVFADGKPRACKLIGVEPAGLWLENEDLTRMAFPDADESLVVIFVPFTQIAYLAKGTTTPLVPAAGKDSTSAAPTPQRRERRRRNVPAASRLKERP